MYMLMLIPDWMIFNDWFFDVAPTAVDISQHKVGDWGYDWTSPGNPEAIQ